MLGFYFLLAFLAILVILFIASTFFDSNTWCSKCKKFLAGKVVDEKLLGVFQKTVYSSNNKKRNLPVIPHGKFKVVYQCKSCGERWEAIITRKL